MGVKLSHIFQWFIRHALVSQYVALCLTTVGSSGFVPVCSTSWWTPNVTEWRCGVLIISARQQHCFWLTALPLVCWSPVLLITARQISSVVCDCKSYIFSFCYHVCSGVCLFEGQFVNSVPNKSLVLAWWIREGILHTTYCIFLRRLFVKCCKNVM